MIWTNKKKEFNLFYKGLSNKAQISRSKHPSEGYVEQSNQVVHYQIMIQPLESHQVSFGVMFIQLPFYRRMLYML